MKKRVVIFCALALISPVVASAFDAQEKEALRVVADVTEKGLRGAGELDGKAITILPIKGDQDGYFERLLIGAFVKAGKTCVVGNDEKGDVRFKRILGEIKWDERQTTLKSVDPATIDVLGRLKSTQMLIEGVLGIIIDEPIVMLLKVCAGVVEDADLRVEFREARKDERHIVEGVLAVGVADDEDAHLAPFGGGVPAGWEELGNSGICLDGSCRISDLELSEGGIERSRC